MVNCLFYKHVFSVCLFITILGTAPSKALARTYEPEFDLPDLPFDYEYDKRGRWCDKQESLNNGTITMKKALKGETINVVLPLGSNYINFQKEDEGGTINPNDPGLLINLLNEVAARGEFEWNFVFVDYNPIYKSEDHSLTDFLVWAVDNFDVVVDWWLQLPSRVELGLSFPRGWYDGSIIVVGRKKDVNNRFSAFSWKGPFSNQVWILLIVTLLVTGILCYVIENGFAIPKLKFNELSVFITDITDHIYMSMIVFTGHMNLKTKTKPGQLVSFSLSFFAMLMLSAYTANLASFLVRKNSGRVDIGGVEDIVLQGKSMCIIDAAKKEAIEAEYKDSVRKPKFVIKLTETDVFKGLRDHDCDFAIASVSSWNEIKNKRGLTYACDMDRVGHTFKVFEAGFVTKSDSGVYCSSLVREVFHVHFLNMHAEGDVKRLWGQHNTKYEDKASCSKDVSEDDQTQVLNLNNMGGIFIFHCTLLMVAIIWSIGVKCHDRNLRQITLCNKKPTEGIGENKTESKRFYSFSPSVGFKSSLKEIRLEEFPIGNSAPNEELFENGSNEVDTPLRGPFYADQNTRIDGLKSEVNELKSEVNELTSEVKDLRQQVGLVLQKIDKMACNEGRNESSLFSKVYENREC